MEKEVEKKICLLGDWGVGKTSLIRRFVYDLYDDKYISTLGVKVSRKTIAVKDFKRKPFFKVNLTLLIWDLVGQKGFESIQIPAYRGTSGAFLVCDITRPETIDSIEWWTSSLFKQTEDIPLFILANKVDLTCDDIPPNLKPRIIEIAEKYEARIYDTSAKTGKNVEESFQKMGYLLTDSFFK